MIPLIVMSIVGYLSVMVACARIEYHVSPLTFEKCTRPKDDYGIKHVCKAPGNYRDSCVMTTMLVPKREAVKTELATWSIWPAILVIGGIGAICLGLFRSVRWGWNNLILPPLEYGVTGHPVREYRGRKTDAVIANNPVKPGMIPLPAPFDPRTMDDEILEGKVQLNNGTITG